MNISNPYYTTSMGQMMNEVAKEISQQKENLLLEQLNDLVSRDLIVIEQTQPVLVQDSDSNKLIFRQAIKLTLKDKEYILKLEEENKQLKETLDIIKEKLK